MNCTKRKSESKQTPKVRFSEVKMVPLATIRPAPENESLYRPVLDDDPEVIALAKSVAEIGIREPLVITLDGYILSGHRRHKAAELAGLKMVPCRVENVRRTNPRFVILLREYNRQRVKTLDEVIREEVLSVDPEESYRLLLEHREQAIRTVDDLATITIVGEKKRAEITVAKEGFLQAIIDVIYQRRQFWPLTDRLIHYALLNDPPLVHASKPRSRYENTLACYKATCELITRARLAGRVPWAAVDDPTRPVVTWSVHKEPAGFIRDQLDTFLKGYYRDLMASQPCHVEIVGEKNTVASIIKPVAGRYTIPYTIGRGYSSLSPRRKLVERFQESGKDMLVLLILSDFDPEGEDIGHSFVRSLRDDFSVACVTPIKVALTADQVQEMKLPPVMKAKEKSSRYDAFVEKHGDDVFELEAVPPERLQEILTEAIDSVIDIDLFNQEIDAEKRDAAKLTSVRHALKESMGDVLASENSD